jgi:hypothetical protein
MEYLGFLLLLILPGLATLKPLGMDTESFVYHKPLQNDPDIQEDALELEQQIGEIN